MRSNNLSHSREIAATADCPETVPHLLLKAKNMQPLSGMPLGREHSIVPSTVSKGRQKRRGPNEFSPGHPEENSLLLRINKKFLKEKKKDLKHPLSLVKSDIIPVHKTVTDEVRVNVHLLTKFYRLQSS